MHLSELSMGYGLPATDPCDVAGNSMPCVETSLVLFLAPPVEINVLLENLANEFSQRVPDTASGHSQIPRR